MFKVSQAHVVTLLLSIILYLVIPWYQISFEEWLLIASGNASEKEVRLGWEIIVRQDFRCHGQSQWRFVDH